ncbi:hypothetical protein LguiB_029845 [Lonicera macranthoides]
MLHLYSPVMPSSVARQSSGTNASLQNLTNPQSPRIDNIERWPHRGLHKQLNLLKI